MACIDVEHLSFTYPQVSAPALADVSLSIGGGEFVLVCGASGSGKTTLLRHLKPALVPHGAREGRILLDGRPIDDLSPREQAELVAFVAQDPNAQVVCDRVWHELAFGLENLGVDPVQMRSRVAEMASYFGIGGWFHRETSELSGGQKQLLNLAAAMVVRPQVLVLDEPTAQLDPIAAADFVATVRKLNLELGTTVVMTEHRLEEVYPLADRVVVMDGGAVAASGAPREVALELHRAASPLELALPTAARVFLGAGGYGGPCPLSVRGGRVWLEGRLGDRPRRDRGGEGLGVAEASGSGEGPTVGRDAPSGAVPARPVGAFGLRPCDSQPDVPPALRLRELWFRYEKSGPDVLRGASLEVPRGAVYALMGANGAGKSTLLKAACGVCRAQRGRVEVLGRSLRSYRGAELFRGCVAMLPQDPASLFVKETVRGELAEMVGDSGAVRPCEAVHPRETVRPSEPDCRSEPGRLEAMAELCAVEGLLERNPRDLSGGERQRVALAKVLLTDPRLVLLDEPTKGLDAAAKREFARLLGQMAARGVTVLMVSHDVEFCAEHATRVGMFFDGQVVAEAGPREFFLANAFYTTAARRMGRGLVEGAVTVEDLLAACGGGGR